jgi:hypothetical protein
MRPYKTVNPDGALGGVVSSEMVVAETALEIPEILGTSSEVFIAK